MTQARRPSPLQRRVLIVLAALDAKCPGPVATRDIERELEQHVTAVRILPLVPRSQADEDDDRPVELDGRWHLVCRGSRRCHMPAVVSCGRAGDAPGGRSLHEGFIF